MADREMAHELAQRIREYWWGQGSAQIDVSLVPSVARFKNNSWEHHYLACVSNLVNGLPPDLPPHNPVSVPLRGKHPALQRRL